MYPKRSDRHAKRGVKGKAGALLISLLALLTLTVGGTVAYLVASTPEVENTFTPSEVKCSVTESFDGTTKSNVVVKNDSNINAYLRVKLVTYRVNEDKQHIGGTADIPGFTLGTGWFDGDDGYYYYKYPVVPDGVTPSLTTGDLTLTGSYGDADGGKQAIDVMAEAIQSKPMSAVSEAWGAGVAEQLTPDTDTTTQP